MSVLVPTYPDLLKRDEEELLLLIENSKREIAKHREDYLQEVNYSSKQVLGLRLDCHLSVLEELLAELKQLRS